MSARAKSVLRALAHERGAARETPRLDLGKRVREPLPDLSVVEVVRVLARESDVLLGQLLHDRLVGRAGAFGRFAEVDHRLTELVHHLDPLSLGLVMPLLAATGGQSCDQDEWGQALHARRCSLSLRRTRTLLGWRLSPLLLRAG